MPIILKIVHSTGAVLAIEVDSQAAWDDLSAAQQHAVAEKALEAGCYANGPAHRVAKIAATSPSIVVVLKDKPRMQTNAAAEPSDGPTEIAKSAANVAVAIAKGLEQQLEKRLAEYQAEQKCSREQAVARAVGSRGMGDPKYRKLYNEHAEAVRAAEEARAYVPVAKLMADRAAKLSDVEKRRGAMIEAFVVAHDIQKDAAEHRMRALGAFDRLDGERGAIEKAHEDAVLAIRSEEQKQVRIAVEKQRVDDLATRSTADAARRGPVETALQKRVGDYATAKRIAPETSLVRLLEFDVPTQKLFEASRLEEMGGGRWKSLDDVIAPADLDNPPEAA